MRRSRPPSVLAVAVLALAGTAGCGQSEDTHPKSRTWTLFEIQAAAHSGGAVAIGPTLPAGIPASALMTVGETEDRLNTLPCFGEGKPCSWVTLEMRVNVPAVWIQPVYAVVNANPDGSVTPLTQPLLADVGPGSTFYSPFWELNYAVVPGTDPDHFHSTRQLFEEHAVIKPVAPHTCPLRPLNVRLAADGSQDAGEAEGMIDGAKAGVFDFGPENFKVLPDGIIEEVPFFKLVKPGDETFGPPNVAGVGPLFSGRPADVTYNAAGNPFPRFGAWWRVYAAIVPATAGAFHAASLTAEQMAVLAAKTDLVLADYEGRVAVDGACFTDAKFPASCTWLDSQASIEAHLGSANLIKTEITGVCPLVRWAGMPVKRP